MDFINQILPQICQRTGSQDRKPDFSRPGVVTLQHGDYSVNGAEYFIANFNRIPHWSQIIDSNAEKAHEWFIGKYLDDIWDFSVSLRYSQECKPGVRLVQYCLWEDLVIEFDLAGTSVQAWYRNTETARVHELMSHIIREFPLDYFENSIIILTSLMSTIEWEFLTIEKPRLEIHENYNDDLLPVHDTILSRLNQESDKGIVLLHGKPGTGKTSYIRFLVRSVRKKVVFIPPVLAADLNEPYMMRLMLNFKNSVLVIEDAESLLVDRNQGPNSAISALLNVTDGLLSDCLGVQLICTFNTDLSRIDKALLRKGRLIARYEFRELEAAKASRLSASLGNPHTYDVPVLLTDVYNRDEPEFSGPVERRSIGF